MVNIEQEQAKAITDLALKLEGRMQTPHTAIVGVVTDGVPIARGIRYALWNRCLACSFLNCSLEYIGARSLERWIDSDQLYFLERKYDNRIYVDWSTKTGELGKMLKMTDRDAIYAVLSDPNGYADICATEQIVPKLAFPRDYVETMKTVGLWVYPNAIEDLHKLGNQQYWEIDTDQSMEFYSTLFQKIKEFMKQDDSQD